MRRKHAAAILFVMPVLAALTCLSYAEIEIPGEVQIVNELVTIDPYEVIQPPIVNAKPGTTVVWINASKFPIEILFLDKKVSLACGAPTNFFPGKGGAYESAQIPRGATASLCFTQTGKYEYVVKSSRTLFLEYGKQERKEMRGTIIIR
jgi:plastocyanin